MTVYPLDIDGFAELPLLIDGVSPIRADDVNRVRDATVAVETELGVNPSGTYGTVRDRLDDLTSLVEDLTSGGALIDVFTTKGDLLTYSGTTATRLPVGSDGYVLTADSSTSTGLNWESISFTTTTAKGDILTHNGTTTVNLPVGTDGYVLTADSSTSTGLNWESVSLTTTTTKGDLLTHNGTSTVNLPVGLDGYFLKADSTQSTGLKWDQLTAGANTALSNLVTTTINTHLIPAVDDGYDLGSSTRRWRDGYFGPDSISIGTSGSDYRIHYDPINTTLVLNQGQLDRDWRVAGSTHTHALFVDSVTSGSPAGTRIGFGTSAPAGRWHFRHDASDQQDVRIQNSNAGSSASAGVVLVANGGTGRLRVFPPAAGTAAFADRLVLQADADLSGLVYLNLASTSAHEFYVGGTNVDNKYLNIATSAITAGTTILPSLDDGYSLGSPSFRWKDGYFGPSSIHLLSTSAETTTARNWGLGIAEASGTSQGRFKIAEGLSEYFCIAPTGSVGIGLNATTPDDLVTVALNQNATTALKVRNESSGGTAFASLTLSTGDSSSRFAVYGVTGSGFTTVGLAVASQFHMTAHSGLTAGMLIKTEAGNAPMIFSVPASANQGTNAASERLRIGSTEIVFNDNAQNIDARWEGSGTRPNLLLVDAGVARVGINRSAGTHGATLDVDNLAVSESIFIARDNGTAVFTIADGGALTSDGGAVFNEAGAAVNLRVESDTNPELLFVSGTGDGYVGFRNNSPNSVLDVAGSVGFNVTTLVTNTTLSSIHHTVLVDAALGTVTITLPTASTASRRRYEIKKIDSVNPVIIDGSGSETIDGGLTYTLTAQYQNITIVCNGSSWHIV